MSETVYINKCSIKEHQFDNGDTILNMAIHGDEFKEHANEDGWLNVTICKRREKSDKGATHYAKVNEYKPNNDSGGNEEDDLPF